MWNINCTQTAQLQSYWMIHILRQCGTVMGLFDGDPIHRFCGMETEKVQHIICCCVALVRQRYNVFGRPTVEPKDISTASIRDLCLFTRGAGLLRLCWMKYWGCTISLRLLCNQCIRWRALRNNVFGRLTAEPKDISTASIRDLCLFTWGTGP